MDAYQYVNVLSELNQYLNSIKRNGLTGAQAEYAVQKYKSHQSIKMSIYDM
jgi:hypothetical protein